MIEDQSHTHYHSDHEDHHHHHHSHVKSSMTENVNVRAAFIHILGDII